MAGRLRRKLAKMLTEETGVEFRGDDIACATGWYRTSHLADTYRWWGRSACGEYSISSFSTVTQCVRHGIDVGHGDNRFTLICEADF